MTKLAPYNYGKSEEPQGRIEFKRVELSNGDYYFGEVKTGTNDHKGRGNYVKLSDRIPWIKQVQGIEDNEIDDARKIFADGEVQEGEFEGVLLEG